MPTLERGRSKHNDLVVQLNRANLKRDKTLDALTRINAKRNNLIRAIARSQKRLAKAATVALVNAPMDNMFKDEATVPNKVSDVTDISWSELIGDTLR